MAAVIDFVLDWAPPRPFDYDRDTDVDWQDFYMLLFCYRGPDNNYPDGHNCLDVEGMDDNDIDLLDFAGLQREYGQ